MTLSLPPILLGELNLAALGELIGVAATVVLDIGANDGLHTQKFLELFPSARIHAFEPDARAALQFKMNVADPRAPLYETAIGPHDGIAEFHVSSGLWPNAPTATKTRYADGWDQSGSLRAPKTHKQVWPWCKFESTIQVPVTRLDSWAAAQNIGQVDLIWADVQGAERDLIAGGGKTLSRTRYLYTEYSNDEWYEGQANLLEIIEMLPLFRVIHRFATDVLLKNTSFN
jgi:FkbM family methyltransferase